jgi:hypothetical protein
MRIIIAFFCPWLAFLTMGKPGKALFAFLLQCSLIGWPIAFWWAVISGAQYYADKRTDRIVNAIKETRPTAPIYQPMHGVPPQYPPQVEQQSTPAIMARYERHSVPQSPQNDGYESIMQHDDELERGPPAHTTQRAPQPPHRATPEPKHPQNLSEVLGDFSIPYKGAAFPLQPVRRSVEIPIPRFRVPALAISPATILLAFIACLLPAAAAETALLFFSPQYWYTPFPHLMIQILPALAIVDLAVALVVLSPLTVHPNTRRAASLGWHFLASLILFIIAIPACIDVYRYLGQEVLVLALAVFGVGIFPAAIVTEIHIDQSKGALFFLLGLGIAATFFWLGRWSSRSAARQTLNLTKRIP